MILFSSNFCVFYKKNGLKTYDGFVFTKKLFSAGSILIIRLIGCLFYNLVFAVGKGGTSVPQALKLKCGRKKE